MKNRIFKLFVTMTLAASMLLGLSACSQTEEKQNPGANGDTAVYTVAIVKQMDHASLDEIAAAIEKQLDAIAAEKNVKIEYKTYSGQGEQSTLKQIGDQAVADDVDAIIPIATLAAQVMTACVDGTDIPVVFAAISDPAAADLTDLANVTGTSDSLNTEFIMGMMLTQNPNVSKIGLLYSLS